MRTFQRYFSRLINSALHDQICFISYNSRGFGQDKENFCRYLLSEDFVGNKIPILCNQENFLLRGNCYKINQAFPHFHTIAKPAIKENTPTGASTNPKNFDLNKNLTMNMI